MIEIRHLKKAFESGVLLKDVNAVIHKGDVIAVIGPSGSGKSTLLRCMNLLERPTSGQIILEGRDILAKGCSASRVRRKMGMVFQSFNLFGHLTVIENVMYAPVKLLGLSRQEAYDRAVDLLGMVGMAGKLLSYPDQLSGGQKQRVAIARTLAMEPEIILFDEPTSALDPAMTAEVQKVIRDLKNQGRTMMIVTHEMHFAREVSNRVFFLDGGVICEEGTPEELFDNPKNERTRQFVRNLQIFETDISASSFDFAGTAGKLEQFFLKNGVPAGTRTKLQSVIEELCVQILMPVLEEPLLHVVIEYSQLEKTAEVTVGYAGAFCPSDTGNTLAYKVLEARSESIEHETDPESMHSTVRVRVR